MQIVPAVATPITAEQARIALVAAMPGIDRETGALLLALVWIETARGHLMNWNPGNITASAKWPGDAWRPPWFDLSTANTPHLVELHELMLHGKAPSAFRAYPSLVDGFSDFARVLRAQFQSVLAAAKTGDARAFVTALHDSGYSHDYSPAHVPGMTALQAELAPQFAGFPSAAQVDHAAGTGAPKLLANIALDVGIAVMAGLVIAAHNEHKRDSRRANRRARREGWLK